MAATTGKQSAMPTADMQWRARKIAMQASRLADQAAPMTKRAAMGARRGAGDAAGWAKPRVGRVRAWMAVRAARGSVSVQENVAPAISSVLAAAARRLDPPKQQTRRWPKVLAGTALLAAGAAAATAMAVRSKARSKPATRPMPQRPPAGTGTGQRSKVSSPTDTERANTDRASTERAKAEAGVNGLSRTR